MNSLRNQEDFSYFEITRPAEDNPALERMLDRVRYLGATILEQEISPAIIESHIDVSMTKHEADFDTGNDMEATHINGIRNSRLKVYEPKHVKLPLLRYKILSNAKHAAGFNRTAQRVKYDLQDPDDPSYEGRHKGRPPGELRKRLIQHALRYDIIESEDNILPSLRCDSVNFIRDPLTGRMEIVLIPNAEQNLVRMLLEQAGICFEQYHKYAQQAAVLASAQSISIPIARLPEDLTNDEHPRLMKAIATEALPFRINLKFFKRRSNDES